MDGLSMQPGIRRRIEAVTHSPTHPRDRVIHALVQRLSPQLDLGAAPNRIGAFHSHPHV